MCSVVCSVPGLLTGPDIGHEEGQGADVVGVILGVLAVVNKDLGRFEGQVEEELQSGNIRQTYLGRVG